MYMTCAKGTCTVAEPVGLYIRVRMYLPLAVLTSSVKLALRDIRTEVMGGVTINYCYPISYFAGSERICSTERYALQV